MSGYAGVNSCDLKHDLRGFYHGIASFIHNLNVLEEQLLQNMSNFVLLYERVMKPLIYRTFGQLDVVFAVVRRVVHSCSAVFVVNFCNKCIIGGVRFSDSPFYYVRCLFCLNL